MRLNEEQKSSVREYYKQGLKPKNICDKLELDYNEVIRNVKNVLSEYKKNNPRIREIHKQNFEKNKKGYLIVYDRLHQTERFYIMSTNNFQKTKEYVQYSLKNNKFTHEQLQMSYHVSVNNIGYKFVNRLDIEFPVIEQKYSYQQTGQKNKRTETLFKNLTAFEEIKVKQGLQEASLRSGLYDDDALLPMNILILELEDRYVNIYFDEEEKEQKRKELLRLVRQRMGYLTPKWGHFSGTRPAMESHRVRHAVSLWPLKEFLYEDNAIHQTYSNPPGSKPLSEVEGMGIDELTEYEKGLKTTSSSKNNNNYEEMSNPDFIGYPDRSHERFESDSESNWGITPTNRFGKEKRETVVKDASAPKWNPILNNANALSGEQQKAYMRSQTFYKAGMSREEFIQKNKAYYDAPSRREAIDRAWPDNNRPPIPGRARGDYRA